uniref:Lipase maturation factor 2 n=1 Tax=Alexandrium monilatum TaxID=311494 RepID=A0A7S4Q127_9DINO
MFEIRQLGNGGNAVSAADMLGHVPVVLADPLSFTSALGSDRWRVDPRYGIRDVDAFTKVALSPRCLTVFFALVAGSCLRYSVAPWAQVSKRRGGSCMQLALALSTGFRSLGRLAICSLALPLLVLCLLPFDHNVGIPFAAAVRPLEQALDPWQVSTSYGLFRRMTGVGRAPGGHAGWGGLPPSVVEVPAVVLEGTLDGRDWKEVPFRYTPGRPTRQPRRTAPHQPRLDWQMWFAALGSYEHHPWFVHLLYKLLEGSDHALALLDVDESPWPKGQSPKFLRAWLYRYDFTRLDTAWARSIPGARVLNVSSSADAGLWWTRSRAREYLPAVSRDSLEDVVRRQGWPVGKTRREAALRRAANCTAAHRRGVLTGRWCDSVLAARRWAEPLRWRTGWTVRSGVLRALWPAASDLFFIDIHFVLLLGPLLAIYGLRCLCRLVCASCFRRQGARAKASSGKVKKE